MIALTHDRTIYTLDTMGLTYTMGYRTGLSKKTVDGTCTAFALLQMEVYTNN